MKFGKLILLIIFGVIPFGGIFSTAIADTGHGPKWGYEGETGPGHWGDLKEEFSLCKTGES